MGWLGLLVALLGMAAVTVGLYLAFWPVAPGLTYARLDARARGELERRVRHDPSAEPADLRLLWTAADIMVVQRNLLWTWLGCFLIQFATTLADWTSTHLLISLLFAVAIGAIALYFERRAEAGAVFMARHRAPDPLSAIT